MKTKLWVDHHQTPELASHDADSLVISVLQWKGNNIRSKDVLYIGLILTYLLTPWSRVLLEKLTGSQLVRKFPTFYGNRRFITAFTSAHHLSLS